MNLPGADRISHGLPPGLLVLSNGHGEDQIALRVIEALLERQPRLAVAVLPLVGAGHSFDAAETRGLLQRVGPRHPLPSGGFSNQSLRGMGRDLAAGLLGLSLRQWRWIRRWGATGAPVLAVGDLLPLAFAWGSGSLFGFIGTPKSDYTWRTPPPDDWQAAWMPSDAYHRCKGSEWDPWEWQLMASRRCRLLAMRDPLTARGLRRHGLPALAPGNPMLDGFCATPPPDWLAARRRLMLLPGSRFPEALTNAGRLLAGLERLTPDGSMTVLLACGNEPGPDEWDGLLLRRGWHPQPLEPEAAASGAAASWHRGATTLLIGPGQFSRWANWAEVGLATAGTATEQLVGLGIPALSLPGPGPQFKAGFARRQSRLLGGAVQPCHSPGQLAERLKLLLEQPQLRHLQGSRGQRRMGRAGGSARLAALVEERLLPMPSLG
jgi:uncharacterized protein (TIGR03492 family)